MNIFVKHYNGNQLFEIFRVETVKQACECVALGYKCGATRVTMCRRNPEMSLEDEIRKELFK